jgi:hypothetical protein
MQPNPSKAGRLPARKQAPQKRPPLKPSRFKGYLAAGMPRRARSSATMEASSFLNSGDGELS